MQAGRACGTGGAQREKWEEGRQAFADLTVFLQVHEVDARAALPSAAPTMQLLMGNDYRRLQTPPESKVQPA